MTNLASNQSLTSGTSQWGWLNITHCAELGKGKSVSEIKPIRTLADTFTQLVSVGFSRTNPTMPILFLRRRKKRLPDYCPVDRTPKHRDDTLKYKGKGCQATPHKQEVQALKQDHLLKVHLKRWRGKTTFLPPGCKRSAASVHSSLFAESSFVRYQSQI